MNGYRVFPLGPDGKPAIRDWPTKATTQPPEHWGTDALAIETTGLLVVDLDVNHENGHDGFASWETLGIVTSDACVPTKSGGAHLFYRLPDGVKPDEVRSSASKIAPGVDVKSWHSYVRVYGDVPNIDELPVAPLALVELVRKVKRESTTLGRVTGEYAATVHPYVAAAMRGIGDRLRGAQDGQHNDVQTHAALRLVELSNNPASGLLLDIAQAFYREHCAVYDDKSAYRWDYAVERQADVMAYLATADEPEPVDELEERYYRESRARLKADRRIAGENYTGTSVVSWDDLATDDMEWLVSDFLGRGTLNYLVARPNLGKSFTLVDMVCNLALGRPWLGKATRRTRSVYVLAEGRSGFYQRLQAWCAANDASMNDLRPWLSFLDGANLNNDESLRRIRNHVGQVDAGLVVIDTYAAASGLPDEDKAGLASLMLNATREAIGPKPALLFAAHPTKTSEKDGSPILRGSGATAGAADVVATLYVDSTFAGSGDDREYLALSTEHSHGGKNRNAETRTVRGLFIGKSGSSAALFYDDSEQYSAADRAILDHLLDGMTADEFEGASGKSRATARRYLKDSSLVRIEQDGRIPRYYLA